MFAIEKGMMKINGEKVETFEREVNCGCAELLVTAGTNGSLDAIMKALIFTGDVLTDQCCEVDD